MSATPIFDEVLRARTRRLARASPEVGDSPAGRTGSVDLDDGARHHDRPALRVVDPAGGGRHALRRPPLGLRDPGQDSSPA